MYRRGHLSCLCSGFSISDDLGCVHSSNARIEIQFVHALLHQLVRETCFRAYRMGEVHSVLNYDCNSSVSVWLPVSIIRSDNSRLASCGGDRQVFLWDVSSGRIVRKFRGHDSEVRSNPRGAKPDSVVRFCSRDLHLQQQDVTENGNRENQRLRCKMNMRR